MHRLVIAVAAVFLIATSTATGQTTDKEFGVPSDKILAEGKVLGLDKEEIFQDRRVWKFVVAYQGNIFNCEMQWTGPVECWGKIGSPAKIKKK